MEFFTLGSSEAIGASCHFLKIEGTGIMLDVGADPENDGPDGIPDFDQLHRHADRYVDHAIITHAHHDHLGALPILIRHFPHVLIHMTRATRDLADLLLPASARLQRRRLREGSSPHEPLFTEEELDVYSYLYLTHNYSESFDLTGVRGRVPVKGRFYHSGHILGAAGLLIEVERSNDEPYRIFYTSDTSSRPQVILPAGEYPEEQIDTLILESTLGADPEAELTTRRTEENKFFESLKKSIDRGGTVLIPVFALGRAQETLALIDRAKKRGIIPEDIPVYTSGSMRAVSDLYDKTRMSTPRLNADFQVFGVEQRRHPRGMTARLNALNEPSIHVASSGMMFERTLSNELAQTLIEDERNAVLLVGFAKEDSPAARLIEAAAAGAGTEVVLSESIGPQPVNCTVERFRFSGHSHRRDLIQIVERMKPKQVILVHGEEAARQWMADNIRYFYPDVVVHNPQLGQALTF
jgi:cleavage and polyadenylation specificity factor subunit 3